MKKIINQVDDIVLEMAEGFALAHPELELNRKYKIIKKKQINPDKVTLISGGGSGHEPAHAGYVGEGMLDAAVCGEVFASPSQIRVYQALKATRSEKGTLLIIKNYSGDIMNFKNAAEMAKEDGQNVAYVKVDDDIAVQDSLYTVGRRGVAGTVLVHKVAGAAAAEGLSLEQVKTAAEEAVRQTRSLGFALTSCTVPAKGDPTFSLPDDEMEYGVGIHGEPGIRREKVLSADALSERMLSALIQELDLRQDDEVTLLINGFGGSPLMELYILNQSAIRALSARGIRVFRCFVGNYMTSIDMQGASISLMHMTDNLRRWISAPCRAPAFTVMEGDRQGVELSFATAVGSPGQPAEAAIAHKLTERPKADEAHAFNKYEIDYWQMCSLVEHMGDCIIANERAFCDLDSYAGDGDFGMSVAQGFKRMKLEWPEILAESDNPAQLLDACAMVIMEYCGGASGPIWGSAFRAAGRSARGLAKLTARDVAGMLQAAVKGIQNVGERSFGRGAVVGDKTLMDALIPAANQWTQLAAEDADLYTCFRKGADAAVQGAKATENIVARMGRAGTVGERSLGYPDAGAHAIGVIFSDLSHFIEFGRGNNAAMV